MKVEQAKALDEQDHRALALWAADCAERVLPRFEGKCPEDDRPRGAIEAGRAWARGEIAMGEARAAAFAAHARHAAAYAVPNDATERDGRTGACRSTCGQSRFPCRKDPLGCEHGQGPEDEDDVSARGGLRRHGHGVVPRVGPGRAGPGSLRVTGDAPARRARLPPQLAPSHGPAHGDRGFFRLGPEEPRGAPQGAEADVLQSADDARQHCTSAGRAPRLRPHAGHQAGPTLRCRLDEMLGQISVGIAQKDGRRLTPPALRPSPPVPRCRPSGRESAAGSPATWGCGAAETPGPCRSA